MSFNLQSLAPETRSNVPTSVLLDHFKAATAAGVPMEGKDNRGPSNGERPAANRRHEMKRQRADVVLDVDGGQWEDFSLYSDANEDSNMSCGGNNVSYSVLQGDSRCPQGDDIDDEPVILTSALPSSSFKSSSNSRVTRAVDCSPLKRINPIESRIPGGVIRAGLTGVSSMTRVLCMWVKAWSGGESSVECSGSDSYPEGSTPLPVLFPPTEEQSAVICTYGVQLLCEAKLDYAAAYLRTLSRLVERMRSIPAMYVGKTTVHAHGKGQGQGTFESQLEDTQKTNNQGNDGDSEGRSRTKAQVWKALRLWEEVVYTVESAMQSKAVDLYGARLTS